MQDDVKRERKILRPGYSFEMNGKGVKSINRRLARKKLKQRDRREHGF